MFYCYGFAATSQLPVVPAGYLPLEDRVIVPDSGTLCDRYEPVRTYLCSGQLKLATVLPIMPITGS